LSKQKFEVAMSSENFLLFTCQVCALLQKCCENWSRMLDKEENLMALKKEQSPENPVAEKQDSSN